MIRRLFRTGNSVVVSLPKEALEALHFTDGNSVSVEIDREQKRVILSPVEMGVELAGIDARFAQQVDEFINEYREALNELAS
jgi:putative addiction module antidote